MRELRVEWSAPRPGRFTTGKDPVPNVQEVGGPQGRSGQVRKISPQLGFDPRTVQSVASRYTDWATRPTMLNVPVSNICTYGFTLKALEQEPQWIKKRVTLSNLWVPCRTCNNDFQPYPSLTFSYIQVPWVYNSEIKSSLTSWVSLCVVLALNYARTIFGDRAG
jgi:hypothetical protein